MSEPPSQPRGPTPPAGDMAVEAAGRLGEHVGRFAVLTMRRFQQLASAGATMAAQAMATPAAAARRDAGDPAATASDAPPPGSATARAEAMVDGAGAQLGTLATLARHQLRRAAALAREEAEDMWAEAQQLRAAQRRGRDEGQGDLS